MNPKIIKNVDVHAVVLIHDNEYYGHIYCWVSPTDPTKCICIGIRARIDIQFMRLLNNGLYKISNYLLEGVKKFAMLKDCNRIVVPYPLNNMENLIIKLNFNKIKLSHTILGQGPGTETDFYDKNRICYKCYIIDIVNLYLENVT